MSSFRPVVFYSFLHQNFLLITGGKLVLVDSAPYFLDQFPGDFIPHCKTQQNFPQYHSEWGEKIHSNIATIFLLLFVLPFKKGLWDLLSFTVIQLVCLFLTNKVMSPSLRELEIESFSSNTFKWCYHTTFSYSVNLLVSLAMVRAFPGHRGSSITDAFLSLPLSLSKLIAQWAGIFKNVHQPLVW